MDAQTGKKAIESFMNLWISPEIDRRRKMGTWPSDSLPHRAQVILTPDGRLPQVRLNEEVRALIHVKQLDGKPAEGEFVSINDIDQIHHIELCDEDLDSGHVTLIGLDGKVHCTFNFQYYRKTLGEILKAAEEFVHSAKHALESNLNRPFVESLWSAVELLSKALLVSMLNQKALGSKTHGCIQGEMHLSVKTRRIDSRWPTLLKELTKLRDPARYLRGPLNLNAERAKRLLKSAQDLLEHVRRACR